MSAEWKQPCWNCIGGHGGPATCVLTWCCPCITYGINVFNLGKDAKEVQCAGEFAPACCAYCLLASAGCQCIMHIPTRKFLRSKYGIKDASLVKDFLMTWCCSCCVLIQEYNEIAMQAAAASGSIFTDLALILTVGNLRNAKDAATDDVKKWAAAAKEGITKAEEEEPKKDEKPEKEAEEEEVKTKTDDEAAKEADEKEEKKEAEAKEDGATA